MYLAETRMLASTGAIWAIIIVATVCLAFWLTMVVGIAPRPDKRLGPRTRSRAIDLESEAARDPLGPATPDAAPAQQPTTGSEPPAVPEPEVTRDDLIPVPGPRGQVKAHPGHAPQAARPPAQRQAEEGARSAPRRQD